MIAVGEGKEVISHQKEKMAGMVKTMRLHLRRNGEECRDNRRGVECRLGILRRGIVI